MIHAHCPRKQNKIHILKIAIRLIMNDESVSNKNSRTLGTLAFTSALTRTHVLIRTRAYALTHSLTARAYVGACNTQHTIYLSVFQSIYTFIHLFPSQIARYLLERKSPLLCVLEWVGAWRVGAGRVAVGGSGLGSSSRVCCFFWLCCGDNVLKLDLVKSLMRSRILKRR